MSQDELTPELPSSAAPAPAGPEGSAANSSGYVPPTPGRCWRGAAIAGGLTVLLYGLTQSIMHVLAGVPIPNKSVATANIAVAVRTLVVGLSTLATAIFAIATLGLLALGVQLLIKERIQVRQ